MDLKTHAPISKSEPFFQRGWALKCLLIAACLSIFLGVAKADEDELWTALREGTAFGMMRHALAPGFGDPENFKVDDCTTQRNLSDEGRKQAQEIGQRFRDRGIKRLTLFSSAWCRCRETAELLDLGPVTTLDSLNSFFQARENREPQTAALKTWLAANSFDTPVILVTHQVNISALTGEYADSGDIIIMRREKSGALKFLGKL